MTPTKLSETERSFNDLFTNAVQHRRTSCFHDTGYFGGSGGGNWENRWDLQEKFAISWYNVLDQSQGYRSNVKSPEISGRLQSTMQKLAKLELGFIARPKREEAKFAAQVAQILIDDVFVKAKAKFRLAEAMYGAITHGSYPVTIDFITKERPVKRAIVDYDLMTDEERKKVEKEPGYIPYRSVTERSKKIVIQPRRLQEIWFDPSARVVHGDLYYAGYYFTATMMPKKRFDKTLAKRSGYKNCDKVRPLGELADANDSSSWFRPPRNMQEDYVYIVEMQGYDDDTYMVRANDQFVYEGPLPYNHKKLNVVMFSPFKLSYQIYGIGMVDFMIPIVTQIELLQNAIYDYVFYTSNPMLLVEKSTYNAFSRHYKQARPGLLLPVMNVNQAVQPLKFMPLSMDVFQALQSLQRDAIIASQQDPSQLGVVQKNATATANIINKEVLDAYVNYILENFKEALDEIGSQALSLVHQYYTNKDVNRIVNGDKKEDKGEAEYSKIMITDKKIDIDWEKQSVMISNAPGEESFIELRPEIFKSKDKKGKTIYINPDEDIQVTLSSETLQIMSEALEIQTAKENLGQLSGYFVDPADRQKVAQHPAPWINGPAYLEWYANKSKLPKNILIKKTEIEEQDKQRAIEQNNQMFKGEFALPQAGESDAHLEPHLALKQSLQQILEKDKKTVQTAVDEFTNKVNEAQQAVQMNPTQQMDIPQQPDIDKKLMDKIEKYTQIIDMLDQHIEIDSQPAYMRTDSVLNGGYQQPQAPMPQGGGMPGGQGGATMMGGMGNMGGGNLPMPNMPGAAGYTQGGPGQLGGPANMMSQ